MTISVPIPAVCRTCHTVFPSLIVISGGPVSIQNLRVGPCPNGHKNAIIPNGTYSLRDGLMQIVTGTFGSPPDLQLIHSLANYAKQQPRHVQNRTLDQIAELLPEESRAAIKQFGTQNPAAAILIILCLISAIASQLGQAYRSFFPTEPSTNIIINYNATVDEAVTSAPEEERAISDGVTAQSGKKGRIQKESHRPADHAPKDERPLQKPKSRRRADLNKVRRTELKVRRSQFPRRKGHR